VAPIHPRRGVRNDKASRLPTSFRRSPDFRTYILTASKQQPRNAAAAMRRVKTHAQSLNVDCWRAGVPGAAHCSPMLKEFFQSHCARGFFFRAHLNHRNLTAKRCLSVDVRTDFKRKFRRRKIGRQKTCATQTNQTRELIRTEPDMLRIEVRKNQGKQDQCSKFDASKINTGKNSSERRHAYTW
jgi:hypothetical protein